MLDVFVAHLEQKLSQVEISWFLNLAYFLHVASYFWAKRIEYYRNHEFSNENKNSSRIDRIIPELDSGSLGVICSN